MLCVSVGLMGCDVDDVLFECVGEEDGDVVLLSWLCVKNVLKYLKDDRLCEYFVVMGEVMDVKIVCMVDGMLR